jgi:hypothetical protein
MSRAVGGGIDYGLTGDMAAEAESLKQRIDGLQSELQFEEKIEQALALSSKLGPEQLAERRSQRTTEEREQILKKVGTNFIESLHVSAPPGVPIDRGRMRSSASLVGRTTDPNYVEPDSPRTQARKAFDKKYPKMEYHAEKKGSLKPLSPRTRAAYEAAAAEIYHEERGEDGQVLTEELREKVQDLKDVTIPDYKSLAMEIYTSEEPGMTSRAIRRLQATEGSRAEKEYREKAFKAYRTDYSKEEFGDAAKDLNDDDYLWQREKGDGGSQFAKREAEKNVFGYRKHRMQNPPHRGQFKDLLKKERKERGLPYLVDEPGSMDDMSMGGESWQEEKGLDEPPPPPERHMDDEIPFSAEELKAKGSSSLKLCLKCCGCCTMIGIFFAPLLGILAVAAGCDSEQRSLDQEFDAMNVKYISVLKDRGDVRFEILPPPQLPADLNNTGDAYGESAVISEKILISATHYARTQTALAQIFTHVRQSGGCQPLSDADLRLVLQRYGRPYVDGLSPVLVNQVDDLLKNPPRFYRGSNPCAKCTCDRANAVCVKCEMPLTVSVVSWWDEGYNSLYDCPRSEIVVKIPRSIINGVSGDTLEWDKELEEYVNVGSRLIRNEFGIGVEIKAKNPSSWMLPLSGDIEIKGQNDVVLSELNLTTNAGGILMEQVSSWRVVANATSGPGINATLVSSPDITLIAEADTTYGNLLPTRGTSGGVVTVEWVDLETFTHGELNQAYDETRKADRSYRSRKETGWMGDVYAGDDAGASRLGHLQVYSELAPITMSKVVHGNISVVMSVEERERLKPTVDLTTLNDAEVTIDLNVFEYQGVYSLNSAMGDVSIEDAGCDSITELDSSGDDDSSSEPSFKAGRIGNTRDTRTLSPMSRRIRVDIRQDIAQYDDVDVALTLSCEDFTRCKLDCSRRGLCTPDTGTCSCDKSNFYNKTSQFYGDGCEFTYCANDCSGKGTCNRATGQCTCFDRWYEPDHYFPCTHIICADGPRKDEMECGMCDLEYNEQTEWVYGVERTRGYLPGDAPNYGDLLWNGEWVGAHMGGNDNGMGAWMKGAMTCAPIFFLTPYMSAAMRIDDLLLFQNNPHVVDGLDSVNMGKALQLLNVTSPAHAVAQQLVATAVSGILGFYVPPSSMHFSCEAGWTGDAGSWNDVEATDFTALARQDLDVSCEYAFFSTLEVSNGLPDSQRMASISGVELPAPVSPPSGALGRRQLQWASNYDPNDYLDNTNLVNNSLLLSLELSFFCPGNCTGPSGSGGICNTSSGECMCNQGRFRDDCYYTTCPGDPLHPEVPGDVECSGAGTCSYLTGRCACIAGRAGVDCSVPDVPCPGNGVCVNRFQGTCDRTTGICTCTQFFMGDDCALPISPCGEDCPGRSYCDAYIGECVCPPVTIRQWGLVPGPAGLEPGRTNIARTFHNVLTYGFGCALAPCLIPLGPPNTTNATRETTCAVETGRGECNTFNGECECNIGYSGEECEDRFCPFDLDPITSEKIYCSGHGACNFTSGICMCEDAYHPDQGGLADCSRLLCQDPSSETGYGLTCGGYAHRNAYCDTTEFNERDEPDRQVKFVTGDGTCKCNEPWVGNGNPTQPGYGENFCELRFCPGQTSFRDRTVCGGRTRGACNYTIGLCECLEPNTGAGCTLKKCPGEPTGYDRNLTAEPHRRNGACSPPATCVATHIDGCAAIRATTECNNLNECVETSAEDNCNVARLGVPGGNDALPLCTYNNGGTVGDLEDDVCEAISLHDCPLSVVGYDRGEATCLGLGDCTYTPQAENRGECSPLTGACSCDAPWERGLDVEYRGIMSIPAISETMCEYKMCPNHCSGNGICDFSNGTCDCYMEPFTQAPLPQPACEMRVCPVGRLTGAACDGQGDCNFATGECTCTSLGVTGTACDERICINDCWGQGTCNRLTGVCFCEEGWTGIDCGMRPEGWGGRRRRRRLTEVVEAAWDWLSSAAGAIAEQEPEKMPEKMPEVEQEQELEPALEPV